MNVAGASANAVAACVGLPGPFPGPSRAMDGACGAYMDVLAASPGTDPEDRQAAAKAQRVSTPRSKCNAANATRYCCVTV